MQDRLCKYKVVQTAEKLNKTSEELPLLVQQAEKGELLCPLNCLDMSSWDW